MGSEQVERANQRERSRSLTLAADVASSALLLGLIVLATVVFVLPVALVVGFLF